ncbi:class I SAM-dependent methyltransferase [Algoriphagus sp.]|uniref:class I SAM-dependent methyltransferase n=1 Tax=Algoriphagus sp. TaxID=1872435 RepID=UPI00262A7C85|nr:class I SAM-dependent methyltransferase [Algoriphagus sp.]
MADQKELRDYYTSYYEKDHYDSMAYKQVILKEFQKIRSQSKKEILESTRYLNELSHGAVFLDVGCGLGLGLAYANQLDCQLYATEFDSGALDFVHKHFSVETFHGDIMDAKYPNSFFDFIHMSHVIEHVLDPIAYIQEMKRIVKPGGIIAIGTPNLGSMLYTFHRYFNLIQMKVPDIIDGVEHTFIFPKSTLANLCKELDLILVDHYTHGLGEKLSNLLSYQLPIHKKVNRLIQNLFQVNQWIICKTMK